jgi:hypothetical protein
MQQHRRLPNRVEFAIDQAIDELMNPFENEDIDQLDVPCLYGNWCGPGCSGPGAPIDAVDACCKAHDQCYGRRGYFACSCDRELVRCLASKPGSAAWTIRNYFDYSPCNPWR